MNLNDCPEVEAAADPLAHLLTVKAFTLRYPDLMSEGSLRWQVYCRDHNGMNEFGVVIQLGRKVYLDATRFWEWLDSHRES